MSRTSAAIPASSRTPRRMQLAARVAAAVLGGYAFAWGFIATCASLMFAAGMGFIATCASLMFAAGMGFHDAEFLASLLGVLVFLVAFLWTFAARRLWVVWVVLAGGGAVLAAAGSLVQSLLV